MWRCPNVFRSMGIARHTFSLTAVQQVGARLSLHGVLVATGERYGTLFAGFDPRAYAYPGFATLNLGAAYTMPLAQGTRSLRVFGRLENAFDRELLRPRLACAWRGVHRRRRVFVRRRPPVGVLA